MIKLVLLRHGESVWNRDNKFTGWTDVDLTEKGIEESKNAAKLLKENNYTFDLAFTSVLKRATETLDIVLKEMGLKIPIIYSWRLNERHYGALQGFNKREKAEKVGEEQVHIWRRSYDVRPPALEKSDERYPGNDSKYKDLTDEEIPKTECLKDVVERVLPFWRNKIEPELRAGKRIIISAHGNSLRAIVKFLDEISDEDIVGLNIPTGYPLVYELDENLKPIKNYYLGDTEKIQREIEKVKKQGKNK